ncbi:LAMI_0G05974g1_1 [Lachancea mirantina]|uniref:tRNA wybutosine-synthesizing protein 3 n=1 Tax=Lachancea mirantina TaxID=1230905 RepID=A0A1G4K954_9SACH|nr:LAMI_0G05974g1_1 [Lachancea mirantina]
MVQDAFAQKKEHILQEISSSESDLSPKGSIDEPCIPIIELINSHPDMVTTSSCSGRVSVFIEGNKVRDGSHKSGGKGDGGKWLFVTHESSKVNGWIEKFKDMIEFKPEEECDLDSTVQYVLYKFEPLILHVKCRNFETAAKLFNIAMSCGFRESGVGSNNIVAMRINIKLDIPIGYKAPGDPQNVLRFFVSKRYITIIDQLSTRKFGENAIKLRELHNRIEVAFNPAKDQPSVPQPQTESKEARRERKRNAGLLRQKALLEAQEAANELHENAQL